MSKSLPEDLLDQDEGVSYIYDRLLDQYKTSVINSISVESSGSKGRTLVAKGELKQGQVILKERAFVYASWDEDQCLACNKAHNSDHCQEAQKLYPYFFGRISEIEIALSEIDGIEDIDKARLLLECLRLIQQCYRSKRPLLRVFNDLSIANEAKAEQSAKEAATKFELDDIFPPEVDENERVNLLKKAIGILNTNCQTLEELGGSGLFIFTCICEHSCQPNCCYSSEGSVLTLTANRAIFPGESLSIDYGDFFYDPYDARQSFLINAYGFRCECSLCFAQSSGQLPDRTRGFKCPRSSSNKFLEHIVFPNTYKCRCGYKLTEQEISECVRSEKEVFEHPPNNIEELQEYIESTEKLLIRHHYLYFKVIDRLAHDIAATCITRDECEEQGLELLWKLLLDSIEFVVNINNPVKINIYDEFAQVYVKLGDTRHAEQYFKKAYELSFKLYGSGDNCSITKKLRNLVDNTPLTVEELFKHYHNMDFENLK